MKKVFVLLLAWQIGCAATSDAATDFGCGWTPDPELHGAHLDTDDCHNFVCQDPQLRARVRKTIEVGADYWGVPHNILWGWKIRLVEQETSPGKIGNVDWLHTTIRVSVGQPAFSGLSGYEIETSSLLHEIGHVALPLGDPDHWDSKWYDDDDFEWALRRLVGECAYMVPLEVIPYYRSRDWEVRDDGCIPTQYHHWWDGY